jgi:hypothetical protein
MVSSMAFSLLSRFDEAERFGCTQKLLGLNFGADVIRVNLCWPEAGV